MTSVTAVLTNFQMKNAGGTSSRGWFSPYSLRDDTLSEIHFFMSSSPSKVAIKNAKVEISGFIMASVISKERVRQFVAPAEERFQHHTERKKRYDIVVPLFRYIRLSQPNVAHQ
jgi:hypothetical protein